MINPEALDIVVRGTPAQRTYACSKSFALFVLYYFAEFFSYKIPPFHFDFYSDCEKLAKGELSEAVWIAFRESGKTTLAKLFVIWCIVYEKKHYINWDSYDRKSAEASLFDITIWLQTNQKILSDWGHFYTEKATDDVKQLKKVSAFITSNRIKVEAFSTGVPTRGRVYEKYRPDLLVFDDLENAETVRSAPITEGVIAHLNEARAGMAPSAASLYVGNYITESGTMRYLIDAASRNPQSIVRNVPVVLKGQIQWPDKYVLTDEEASGLNTKIDNSSKKKVSLESKERTLGKTVYASEMLNDPVKAGDLVFDRRKMDELMRNCIEPKDINAGLSIWDNFKPGHRYVIASDSSEGVGRDSSASVCIDFTKTPCEQIASYANDRIAPDSFGYELVRQGNLYGKCLIAPEINNPGLATLAALKEKYDLGKIYMRQDTDKATLTVSKKLGWRTTSGNKSEIIFKLKSGIEDGELMIRDERILKEARSYGVQDLSEGDSTTRHFDLLIATAICWQMRNNPQSFSASEKEIEYVQKPYQSSSMYESNPKQESFGFDPFSHLDERISR